MAPSKQEKKRKGISEGDDAVLTCCVPADKVVCAKPSLTPLTEVVKVVCSSAVCPQSGLLHSSCFSKWESGLLLLLARVGRGRTWTEKQRQANLWTHKGYDLIFKSCQCNCGHGSLRKDLDYQPPEQRRQEKKKEKTSQKPKLNNSWQSVSGQSYYGKTGKDPCVDSSPSQTKRSLKEYQPSPSPTFSIPGLSPEPPTSLSFPDLPGSKAKVENCCVCVDVK